MGKGAFKLSFGAVGRGWCGFLGVETGQWKGFFLLSLAFY